MFSRRSILLAAALAAAPAIALAQEGQASEGAAPEAPAGMDLAPAMRAAHQWLDHVDRRRYRRGWEEASSLFRQSVARVKWEASVQSVREALGAVVRRKLLSATYATTLPGAPPGEYVVIRYSTTFEKRPLAVETVTPVREPDGRWKVSGYYIR